MSNCLISFLSMSYLNPTLSTLITRLDELRQILTRFDFLEVTGVILSIFKLI